MNINLPAILGFTRYQGFDPYPYFFRILGKENGTARLSAGAACCVSEVVCGGRSENSACSAMQG